MIVKFQAYNDKYRLYAELFVALDIDGNVHIINNGVVEKNIQTLMDIYISTVSLDVANNERMEGLSYDDNGFLKGVDKSTVYMVNDTVVRKGIRCCIDYEHGEDMSTCDFINKQLYHILKSVIDESNIDVEPVTIINNEFERLSLNYDNTVIDNVINTFEFIRRNNVSIKSYSRDGVNESINLLKGSDRSDRIHYVIDNLNYECEGINFVDNTLYIHHSDKLIPYSGEGDVLHIVIPHIEVDCIFKVNDVTLDVMSRCYIMKGVVLNEG